MTNRRNNRTVGTCYEEKAASFLQDEGVLILEHNYRCKQGEIDLIGLDGDCLVFFEVKFRNTDSAGFAAEAVHEAKQKKISRVADFYLYTHPEYYDSSMRFDVIAFDSDQAVWYQNAFDYHQK